MLLTTEWTYSSVSTRLDWLSVIVYNVFRLPVHRLIDLEMPCGVAVHQVITSQCI